MSQPHGSQAMDLQGAGHAHFFGAVWAVHHGVGAGE
jgi:hypothetical protein